MRYNAGFRNNVIKKVLPPENTVRNWLFKFKNDSFDPEEGVVFPEQKSSSKKISLLFKSRSLYTEGKQD